MAAGMKYDLEPLEPKMEELCRFETVFRYSGGFNLVIDNLVAGSYVPPLAPLALDYATRKAIVVKNVKVVEAAANDATSLKIAKKSLAFVGMFIGTGTKGAQITAINSSNANYDTITLAATLGEAVVLGQVLFESTTVAGTAVKNKAVALNYAYAKVEAGASVTAMGRAYEIAESKLVIPISAKDKETLTDRFMFVL